MSARSHGNELFDHRPERVVINGCRCAMAGYDHGDPSCWDQFWSDLVGECGVEAACEISGTLQNFVRQLRSHCQRPLNFFPRACRWACVDECLALSLLSACQNTDAAVRAYCLDALQIEAGAGRFDVTQAAELLAQRLSLTQLPLMPVPLAVIVSAMERTCRVCPVAAKCRH
ncbi:MAG: hypothetical protein IPM06_10570 [Rhizobiales bacterium]|nr:hypothetical protein [Hyphomicrobiales bacterium]